MLLPHVRTAGLGPSTHTCCHSLSCSRGRGCCDSSSQPGSGEGLAVQPLLARAGVGAGLRERAAPALLPAPPPAPSRQERRPPGAPSHQNETPVPLQARPQPVGSQRADPAFSHRVSEQPWNRLARTFPYMEEINPYRAGLFIRVFSQSGFTRHRAAESWEPCARVAAVIGRSLSPVLLQHLMEQLMGVYLCAPRNCVP